MVDKAESWLKRAREVLGQKVSTPGVGSEAVSFATSILTAIHGPQSPQVNAFLDGCNQIQKNSGNPANAAHHLFAHAHGTIRNAVAEIEGGLITSLQVLVAGEILAELVRLGKEILQEHTEEAKNVSAVLIAAAYEDLMRRMGQELASFPREKQKLEDVVNALKTARVLKGGEVTVALGYLKFRNDSLHADWTNVSRAQVESCVGFMEALLVKYFS